MKPATAHHRASESRHDDLVKLDDIVTVRLSAEEKAAWQAAADADKRKLADWVRLTVNAALKPPTKKGGR